MADSVGSPGGGDPGSFGSTGRGAWPSQPPTRPPAPATEPAGPADRFAEAPTEPELPRTLEAAAEPAGASAPFFYDLSGAPPPPPGDPFASAATTAGFAPPGATPGYPQASGYAPGPGYPPAGYPPPPYGYGGYSTPYGPYAYGGYAPPKNNGLAIAAMVLGIAGIGFCQIFAIPALIIGFIARKQIRQSEGAQTGDAFALTGIITGGIATVLLVLMIVLYAGMFGLAISSGGF